MSYCRIMTKCVLIFLTITNCAIITSSALKSVTISKCCKFDEFLSNENKCIKSYQKLEWNIKIFNRVKQQYYEPHNTIPPNWHVKDNVKPPCQRPALMSAVLSSYVPFQNGSVFLMEYDKMIPPTNYCIDYNSVLLCLEDEQDNELNDVIRVKKCCGTDAIFSELNKTCIKLKDASYKIDLSGSNKVKKMLVRGFPACQQNKLTFIGKLHEAQMQDNGSLLLPDSKMLLQVGNYCLEHVLENAGRSASIVICQEHLPPSVLVEPATSRNLRRTLYPIGLALSAVFLAATLAAGALLPASHHVLHWRCQTNHVACLLVGDVLLCIIHLSGRMDTVPCFMIAVVVHFLFLAAFFWLNTMCFNIWWTFRDLRPQSVEKNQERCRLRLYEVYAWGGPIVIAGTAALLDLVPTSPEVLRPQFGENKCWFRGDMEVFAFFYGPVGLLLIVNLALFVLTARELTCGLWKRELVKSTTERAALGRVCLKLVIVMGVTWMADIISWLVGGPDELWYLTDMINSVQGVFIFIVVGCQPQVLAAVKRLWCWRKNRENGTAGTTNHHSSSSQGAPSMGDTVTNHSCNTTTTKSSVPLETSC